MQRKFIPIEDMLTWAYRDELPKQIVGGLTGWERLILLGTDVDVSHREASLPVALGPPHPDALLLDRAVRSLEPIVIDWSRDSLAIMGELAPYLEAEGPKGAASAKPPEAVMVSLRSARAAKPSTRWLHELSASGLIMLHARMGTRPHWDLGHPRVTRVNGKNGKPIVQHLSDDGTLVDGRTTGRHYGPGARCPLKLEPPARDIAFARAEYAAWHAGLVRVTEQMCAWIPSEYVPIPPRAPAQPWVAGEVEKPSKHRSGRVLEAIA